jgi:DNA-binding MarR family transcriptional regulator
VNPSTLAENEFILIREISRQPISTQRDLSHNSGLSLGMTNLLLKRLARKGLIKVKQIDWKRTQYLLTPKGAVEKTRKMYDYTRYTVRLFRQIQENVTIALRREHEAGRRAFWIVAQDELAGVLRETLEGLELRGASVSFASRFSDVPENADLVLTATQESSPERPGLRVVSLVDFLDVHFRLP